MWIDTQNHCARMTAFAHNRIMADPCGEDGFKRSSQAGPGGYFVSEYGGLPRESCECAAGGAVLRVPLKDA
jgi:hypothetical protein